MRCGWEHDVLGALWAGAKEFKFMIEILVSSVLADLIFQFVDRAGGIDGSNCAALGADQIIAVLAGKNEGKVGGAFVQSEATNNAGVGQAMEEPVDGGLVTLGGKRTRLLQSSQGHGTVGLEQGAEENLKGLGAAKATGPAAFDEFSQIRSHVVTLTALRRERQDFSLFPVLIAGTRES